MSLNDTLEPENNQPAFDLLSPAQQGLGLYKINSALPDCEKRGIPYLKAVNHTAKKVVIFKPRCRMWDCPQCSQINKALWTWRASHGASWLEANGARLAFVTLTSHEKLDAAGSIAVLPSAWGKVRDRMRRAAPNSEYFIVPEAHKNGRVHLHMITSATLPRKWWKDAPRACGMGYKNDAREVKSVGGVVGYVSKYLTKTLQFSNFGKGFRRVRTSQGWPALPKPEDYPEWTISRIPPETPLSALVTRFETLGYDMTRVDHKTAWELITLIEE